ncbi:hypothetical protein V6N13_001914 [Hibiscus sabdariffa]
MWARSHSHQNGLKNGLTKSGRLCSPNTMVSPWLLGFPQPLSSDNNPQLGPTTAAAATTPTRIPEARRLYDSR